MKIIPLSYQGAISQSLHLCALVLYEGNEGRFPRYGEGFDVNSKI
jgi:hypothetical protein